MSAGSTSDTTNSSNVFAQDSYSGVSFRYRKYFGKVGLNFGVEFQNASEDFLSASRIKEQNRIFLAGVSYRFLPFKDPLTFWGQSFLNFDLAYEYLRSDFEVKDASTSLSSTDDSTGWSLEAKYYLPLDFVWVHIGLGLRKHDYQHEAFGFRKNSIQQTLKVGVSYAF